MKAEASELAIKLNIDPKSFKNSKLRSKKELRSENISINTQEESDTKFINKGEISTKHKLANIEELDLVDNASFKSNTISETRTIE